MLVTLVGRNGLICDLENFSVLQSKYIVEEHFFAAQCISPGLMTQGDPLKTWHNFKVFPA